MFKEFFDRRQQKREQKALIHEVYRLIVAQSRSSLFYRDHQVPDTPEGRYEVLTLHMWLVLRRLGSIHTAESRAMAQDLFDLMFSDMDLNLRELGVNDIAVGKRIRRMVESFYGRIAAYDDGVAQGNDALAAALERNLYHTVADVGKEHLEWMILYVRKQMEQLESLPDVAMMMGRIVFCNAEDV